jgi:hypothetical protein
LLLKQHYYYINEEVQLYIIKRHTGSNFIPVGRLYKLENMVEGRCLYGLVQKIKHRWSPRKNVKHSHEVRVEGWSKGGLNSSAG